MRIFYTKFGPKDKTNNFMKKAILTALASAAMMLGGVNAQAQSEFNKGDLAFNLDFNLGSDGVGGYNGGNGATAGFSLLGEYGFMNVINEKGTISAGLLLGAGFNSGNVYDFSRVRIGTRGTLHYSFIPQLDTYAGLNFCFVDIEKVKLHDGYNSKNTDVKFVVPAIVAGCRYMFTSNLGANFECSWDRFQHIAIGLTFKF